MKIGLVNIPSKKIKGNKELLQAIKEFNDAERKRLALEAETGRPAGYVTTNYQIAKETRSGEVTREEFENQRKVLKALAETSKHLAIETKITTILERIAESVAKALGAQRANFWDFTADRKGAYIIAAYGMQSQYTLNSKKNPIALGTAWVGRAMTTGQAWSTSDLQKDPLLPKAWLSAAKKQNYRGLLCVPLEHGDEIIGGMCIYHKDEHEWQYFEYEVMTIVANQAATALMNARTFDTLEAERRKTTGIINSLQDGLVMYDNDDSIIIINPAARKLLQLEKLKLIGMNLTEETAGDNIALRNLLTIKNIQHTEYSTKEIEIKTSENITLEVTRVPVHDEKLQKIGVVQILHDTTEEREVQILKSNFVSVASHQIRTPLTGIRWAVDVLRSNEVGELTPAQQSLLEKVSVTTDHFAKLINDLLDVSRLDEGRMDYEFSVSDVTPIVQRVYHYLSPSASARSISFNFTPPKEPLRKVKIDIDKIDIAIQNIIDNAIKYSKPKVGKVDITIQVHGETLMIIVKDNGIGIPDNQKKFLFNKFFRADNAVRTVPNSSGLGLYIAKEIIEMHNGMIQFESTLGKGSTFMLQLPLTKILKSSKKKTTP